MKQAEAARRRPREQRFLTAQPTDTDKEPVELTLWITSRNEDDWSLAMEEQFLAEHPWITLNKVVKEGDPEMNFIRALPQALRRIL